MKKRQVALYDPYLDTLGGGERHILSILKVLEDYGYDLTIFWDTNLAQDIEEKLHIGLRNKLTFLPNMFSSDTSRLQKMRVLRTFDTFIYVTDGSYFYSPAKNNYIFCMVPDRNMYQMGLINKVKTYSATFIANSQFTQQRLNKWGIAARMLYPYVDEDYVRMDIKSMQKKPVILSVGRFFNHLHAKKQDEIINSFKKLKKTHKEFSSFKLILAGGLKKEDTEYFSTLEKMIADDSSIELKPNISYKELQQLYHTSLVYWHFTGYGVDENSTPQNVEHLGITPLEAMASGCITYCYNAGGPKEIINNGKNGFLFDNHEDLHKKMNWLITHKKELQIMRDEAKKTVKETFSYDIFTRNVKNIFNLS